MIYRVNSDFADNYLKLMDAKAVFNQFIDNEINIDKLSYLLSSEGNRGLLPYRKFEAILDHLKIEDFCPETIEFNPDQHPRLSEDLILPLVEEYILIADISHVLNPLFKLIDDLTQSKMGYRIKTGTDEKIGVDHFSTIMGVFYRRLLDNFMFRNRVEEEIKSVLGSNSRNLLPENTIIALSKILDFIDQIRPEVLSSNLEKIVETQK